MLKITQIAQGFGRKIESMPQRYVFLMLVLPSLVVFGIVYAVLSHAIEDGQKVQQQAVMVSVVVAKEDIPQRTILQDSMLKLVEMPADTVPADAVTNVQSVVGKPVKVTVLQGDVVTERKVLADVKLAGFTGQIPPDCRAISVGISDITGIAGFAKPGDYVDVMVISEKDKNQLSGRILLQNVLLLAINKTTQQVGSDTKSTADTAQVAKDKAADAAGGSSKEAMATATLALSPQEALELAVTAKEGTIYLVLRPFKPKDTIVVDTDYFLPLPMDKAASTGTQPAATAQPSYTGAATGTASSPAAPAVPAAPASPQAVSRDGQDSILVIRGTESSSIGVNR